MTILKIFIRLVAAMLIVGILIIVNTFFGNPISAMVANKAIRQYVGQNYSHMDLETGKVKYNFKDGSYVATVKSKTSIDTKFFIHYRGSKINRDTYESDVLGMFNTLDRLSKEYSATAKKIIAEELGYENNTTMVMYDKDEYENANANDILELDMEFDKALPISAEVTIRLDLKDDYDSLESIAKVLTDAHKAFADNGCSFRKYSLYAENDGMLVMVNEVTPSDIESGELIRLLEEAQNDSSESRINVFIKGK
jgi:hypothetical protein